MKIRLTEKFHKLTQGQIEDALYQIEILRSTEDQQLKIFQFSKLCNYGIFLDMGDLNLGAVSMALEARKV